MKKSNVIDLSSREENADPLTDLIRQGARKLIIDPALKSMKPFALSLSKGQYTQGLRQAQPERS